MYLYQVPFESLDNGLKPLQCDEHVVDFLYHASYMRFMNVYLDDQPMRNITMLTSAIPSTVKITDLEDGGEENENEVPVPIEVEEVSSDGDVEGQEAIDELGPDENEFTDEGSVEDNGDEHVGDVNVGHAEAEDEMDHEWMQWLMGEGAPPEVGLPGTPEHDEPDRVTPEVMKKRKRIIEANSREDGQDKDTPLYMCPSLLEEVIGRSDENVEVVVEGPSGVTESNQSEVVGDEQQTEERIRERKRKGKSKAVLQPCTTHKRAIFAEGSTIQETVVEVQDEEVYDVTQEEEEPQLDGNGDIRYADPRHDEYQFCVGDDYFDNNELEQQLRRERLEAEKVAGVKEAVISELETTMKYGSETSGIKKKSGQKVGEKRKRVGTYAKFVKPYKGMHNENEDSDEESEDMLERDEIPEELVRGYDEEDSNSLCGIPFNEDDMQNPRLHVNLVFSSREQAKQAMTWYALVNKKIN